MNPPVNTSGTDPNSIYGVYSNALSGTDHTGANFTGASAAVGAKNDDIATNNAQAAAKIEGQRAQDASDPGKAQMVLLPNNGGYAFYDGAGNQLNINQYSLLTGKRPDEILADSPVAKDQKFVQDYKTLMALSNAWVNGDTQTLQKLRAADPKKFNSLISTYKSPADMVKAFTDHWSDYYSTPTNAQNSGTSSFSPQQIASPTKDESTALGGTNLAQVLTPDALPTSAPNESLIDKLNPFSSAHQAVNTYKKAVQANPWFAYQQSLYGK